MPDEADLITVAEASARTGYTTRHITRLIRAGKIAGKKIGPIWLTTVEAVEVYRRSNPKPGPRPGSSRR
jgi:excisionase family DNA binding protein